MRTICRAWCFLFGHKVFEPTGGVQACQLCHDAREWNVAGFTAREFTGIVRWPFYCMWRRIRDFAKGFKAQFFCHQCGWLILKRVDRSFCSQKCSKEWSPF
jgi:hypothetical protein